MTSTDSATLRMALGEDERLLRESAHAFVSERAPISEFRKLRNGRDPAGYSTSLWREMADLGWAGMLVPESYGGVELGHSGAAIVCEALGRHLTASPFISTAVMLVTALRHYASEPQKARLLPEIASGAITGAVAVDEAAKHAPDRVDLEARPSGEAYVLNGRKCFVDDGVASDLFVVAARGPQGLLLFLVDKSASGLRVERQFMVDYRSSAQLIFEQVNVSRDAQLNGSDAALDHILNAGRVSLSAELLGCAQQIFKLTVEYLAQRKQFGVPLATFQALQFRVAALFTKIETARSTVLAAARRLDADEPDAVRYVSLAKAKTGAAAMLAAAEGVQLHGGMGMTDEMDVGLYMKRIRVAQERYGDVAFHADRLARLHGY